MRIKTDSLHPGAERHDEYGQARLECALDAYAGQDVLLRAAHVNVENKSLSTQLRVDAERQAGAQHQEDASQVLQDLLQLHTGDVRAPRPNRRVRGNLPALRGEAAEKLRRTDRHSKSDKEQHVDRQASCLLIRQGHFHFEQVGLAAAERAVRRESLH